MKRTVILLLLALFPALLNAQGGDKPLAKIGNISISEKEFTARYELTPLAGIHDKQLGEGLKKRLLYTLIAEKLFAREGIEHNIDTNDIVNYSLKYFEKMFVRDALYRKEVKGRSLASADSLLSGYISNASQYVLLSIYFDEKNEADKVYNLVRSGVPFDSLYLSLKVPGKDTLTLRIGDLDQEKENELLKLKGEEVSAPVEIKDGWYICKIIKRNDPVVAKMQGWEQEYKNLQKVAAERAENRVFKEYTAAFFKDKKIDVNSSLLKSFASKISALFEIKSKNRKSDQDELFLGIPDLLNMEVEFGEDSLKLVYAKLGNRNVSLKEFMRYFRSESFLSKKYDYSSIAGLLSSKTRKFIEQELLAEEGYRQGLQNLPEVKNLYNMWRDNYLYKIEFSALLDSLSGKENLKHEAIVPDNAQDMYSEIKVAEIVTDDLDKVDKVLNELNNGAKISDLAVKYSKFGFKEPEYKTIAALGDIGKIAAGMETGAVYGPLETSEGYKVFMVLDKKGKQTVEGVNNSAGEINDSTALSGIIKHTVNLANKYKISVNEDMLKNIKRSNINSLIFQNLGFGGRITAVPFVIPYDQWVKEWKENSNNIQ